jgi:hypothetical protein
MDAMWTAFAVVIMVLGLGTWLLFRSMRKWRQPPGRDAESRGAEARLWSTLNNTRS